ncbi:hypothetical protein ACVWWJ_000416 [Luteibacter sp. HA06]
MYVVYTSTDGQSIDRRQPVKNGILAALVTLMLANQVNANDALLVQALSQRGVPQKELRGTIETKNTVLGGREPDVEKKVLDIEKHPDQLFASYDELRKVIGADAVAVPSAGQEIRYRFTTHCIPDGNSMPKGVKIDDGDDIEFQGDALVNYDSGGRPYVRRVQLHMRRASGPMIGRIKKMDLSYDFAPSREGQGMVPTSASATVDIRFMFFLRRRFLLESVFSPTNSVASVSRASG